MNANEAISTLAQVANIFRATQDLVEALEVARQVESNRAAFEAESRQLEEARADLARQREAVAAERAAMDAELSMARVQAQAATAAMLEDEQRKCEGYIKQTEDFIASQNARLEEVTQIRAGMEAQRDALAREIHQLEDKRDELKGVPVVPVSAQVRLPHE